MAADQGLIQASLQEALSKVGPDKTKFYKSQVDTPLAATISISSVFQKKNEEKQEAWDAIAEPVEVMMRKLSSGSDQLGGMHPANVARLKELQKEFYAAYGNKEKEDEIKFKIEQVASEINVIAAGFGKFGQSYLDGTLNITESNPEFYKSFGKIWDVDGKYDDVEFGWDDNNKLSVTTNGKTQKVTDLFNGLVLDNTAPSIELGNLGAKATKWAKWDSKAFKRGVLENMKTKEDYANLIGKDTFGDVSFKEALATLFDQDEKNDNPDIVGIMKNLGIVVDENNKATLYEAITDIHNKNFNLEQAKNIASQWYTDGYGMSKFKEGRKIAEENETIKTQNNYVIEGQYIPKTEVDPTIKLLNSNKDYPTDTTFNGVVHKRENGVYKVLDKETNDWTEVTRDELAATIGILSERYGYQREVATNWEDATGEEEVKKVGMRENKSMFGARGLPFKF